MEKKTCNIVSVAPEWDWLGERLIGIFKHTYDLEVSRPTLDSILRMWAALKSSYDIIKQLAPSLVNGSHSVSELVSELVTRIDNDRTLVW